MSIPRVLALTGTAAAVLIASAAGTAALGATGRHPATAAHPAAIAHATLYAVSAVPNSADLWGVGSSGSGVDNDTYFVLHRHAGVWHRLAAPKLGGRYGSLTGIDAASASVIWLYGARQVDGIQGLPTVWRLTGSRWVVAKVPTFENGATTMADVSASSATNAWAVGGLWIGADATEVAMHWNGRTWTAVDYPDPDNSTLLSVSTSSPGNAWAVMSDGTLLHWNGHVWADSGTPPTNVSIGAISSRSASSAYAVGTNDTNDHGVILKWNGHTWTTVKTTSYGLAEVTQKGTSVWALGDNHIVHSTGGAFTAEKVGGSNDYFSSLSAESSRVAYLAGQFYNRNLGIGYTLLEAFNGRTWSSISS